MTGMGQVAGVSWAGGGKHEGHTVTAIERWPARVEKTTVEILPVDSEGWRLVDSIIAVTVGRVRCTCGAEWNVGGWPAAYVFGDHP